MEQVRHAMMNRPLPCTSDLMRQMHEHSRLIADMLRWLDGRHAGHAE